MALIAKELLKHKKVLDYTSKYESYIRENTDNKTWIVNTNKLVKFYKGVDGLKTGYTEEAGSSIAVTALKNNLRLIAISFGYQNTTLRNKEAISMLDCGFNQYQNKKIISKEKVIKKLKLDKADKNNVDLVLKDDLNITIPKGQQEENYTYNIKLNEIKYPVKKGQTLGKLYLKTNNKTIVEADLTAGDDIKKASIFKQYTRVIKSFLTGVVN